VAAPKVAKVYFNDPAWRYTAVIVAGAGGPPKAIAIVAMPMQGTLVGNNLATVVLQPEAGSRDGWVAKAFANAEKADVVKSLMANFSISGADALVWTKDLAPNAMVSAQLKESKDYDSGLLMTDPLHTVVTASPAGPEFVALLASVGYKAADMFIDKATGQYTRGTKLNVLAFAVEQFVATTKVTEADWTNATDLAFNITTPCMAQSGQPAGGTGSGCEPKVAWETYAEGGPFVISGWVLSGTRDKVVSNGYNHYCVYKNCATFSQHRRRITTLANCAQVTCTQIRTVRRCVEFACPAGFFQNSSLALPPACPALNTCNPGNPSFGAGDEVIADWGPLCP